MTLDEIKSQLIMMYLFDEAVEDDNSEWVTIDYNGNVWWWRYKPVPISSHRNCVWSGNMARSCVSTESISPFDRNLSPNCLFKVSELIEEFNNGY